MKATVADWLLLRKHGSVTQLIAAGHGEAAGRVMESMAEDGAPESRLEVIRERALGFIREASRSEASWDDRYKTVNAIKQAAVEALSELTEEIR